MPAKGPKKPQKKPAAKAVEPPSAARPRARGGARPRAKMSRLGEKLDRLFASEKDNQSQLARRMGWTDTQVSRWRSGAAAPDPVQLLRLARQFGVGVEYLIDDQLDADPRPEISEDEKDILKMCRNLRLDYAKLQQRLWQLADIERQLDEGPKPLPPGRGDTGGNRGHRSG